tara:strand:- start:1901 stop:2293 length:393 start_codon:yes stop_codon:yes gene_type:complete
MSDVDLGKLLRVYRKIRTKRADLSAKFKEEDGDLKEQQDTIKQALLKHCEDNGVESVRTPDGLFYRTVKTRYWTSDWGSMHKFIMEHEIPEFFEKRLNQKHVKEFLEENPDVVPPGLNADSEFVITVRSK